MVKELDMVMGSSWPIGRDTSKTEYIRYSESAGKADRV